MHHTRGRHIPAVGTVDIPGISVFAIYGEYGFDIVSGI